MFIARRRILHHTTEYHPMIISDLLELLSNGPAYSGGRDDPSVA